EAIATEKSSSNLLKMHVLDKTRYGNCISNYRPNYSDSIGYCGNDKSIDRVYVNLLESRTTRSKFIPKDLLKLDSSIDVLKEIAKANTILP
ncbi:MAG: hypothetical protein ACRDBG_26375, partial [Waterburya sp.]